MPERFSKQVAEKMGYTPISEAIKAAESAAEKAAHRAKLETVEKILYGSGNNPFFADATIVQAWRRRQSLGPREFDSEWRLIVALIENLEMIGGKMIGFSVEKGPETLPFDPNTHKAYSTEGLREGDEAEVLVPGLEVDGEIIRAPRVGKKAK